MTTLISRDELKAAIDAGAVTVVDALGGTAYEQEHLPRAIPLVEADVEAQAPALLPDKDALIAVYCANPSCPNSQAVATKLAALGYRNLRKYREGIQDWVAGGLPTESGAVAA